MQELVRVYCLNICGCFLHLNIYERFGPDLLEMCVYFCLNYLIDNWTCLFLSVAIPWGYPPPTNSGIVICSFLWRVPYKPSLSTVSGPAIPPSNTYSNYKLWEYYRWWSPILASSFVAIRITNRRRSTQRLGQMGCFFFAGRVQGEPVLGMNRVRWPYKWVIGGITPTSGVTGPYLQLFFFGPTLHNWWWREISTEL